ncbi:MAG: BolA family protein [Francisellaceae bacterium]
MPSVKATLEERLTKAFNPEYLELIDETHKHIKHKHFQTGKLHFKLIIGADSLSHLSKLKAHQAIYAVLSDMMETHIHALSIEIKSQS